MQTLSDGTKRYLSSASDTDLLNKIQQYHFQREAQGRRASPRDNELLGALISGIRSELTNRGVSIPELVQ